MKKVRRISMESSPSSSSFPIGEEAKKRFKHQIIMQDYLDLLKDTAAKRQKIRMANQKKIELFAVVKFLRRKLKCLSKNPSKRTPYRLKKQPPNHSSTSIPISKHPLVQSDVPLKAGKHDIKEAAVPSTPVLLDLNQISSPNSDEAEEFHVELEPPKLDWYKRCVVDGDGDGDARNVMNRVMSMSKSKICWQDQDYADSSIGASFVMLI